MLCCTCHTSIYPSIGQGGQPRFPSSSAKNCTTTQVNWAIVTLPLLMYFYCSGRSAGPISEEMDMMKWIRQHMTPRIKWLMLLFRTLPRLKMPDRAAKCEMRLRNATAICDREKATKRKIPKRPSAAFRLPTSLNNRYIHIMREVDHFTHYLTDALYYTFSFTDWDSSRSSILRITLFVCSARLSVKICRMLAHEFQRRVIDVSYRVR